MKRALLKRPASSSQMDFQNRAKCFAFRFPARGKPLPIAEIITKKLVKKMDGEVPTQGAISEAANSFLEEKETRGSKEGWRTTSKAEDKQILKTFHKVRPPGHGATARKIQKALPVKIKKTIGKRTLQRRLAEKGFLPEKKLNKKDPGPQGRKRRLNWCKLYEGWTSRQWVAHVDAVADFKEFTWYPSDLRPRFNELRARWTYMNKEEKIKPAFQRPNKWFPKKDYDKTKKVKVFGMTASNGKMLSFLVPMHITAEVFATFVKKRIGPFLRKSFPSKNSFRVLIDGEKIMHAPPAKASLREFKITALPNWPAHSPDLNPQENVWSGLDDELRAREDASGDYSFDGFGKNCLAIIRAYPAPEKLIPGMPKRIAKCIEREGAMIGK